MLLSFKPTSLNFIALALLSSSTYALNPVQGFYGGIFLGGSYSPTVDINLIHPITHERTIGNLSYSFLGDIGGQVGYRCDQFRVEAEPFYNTSPYHSITLNNRTFYSRNKSPNFRFKGRTNIAAIMANAYYDMYFFNEQSNFVPYIGAGLGYAQVQNSVNFYCDNVPIGSGTLVVNSNNTCTLTPNPTGVVPKFSVNNSSAAAQAIVGFGYFLDDFTTAGIDVRHFSTKTVAPFNSRAQFTSINITLNGAFDNG